MISLPIEEHLRKERNEAWSQCALLAKTDLTSAQQLCTSWSKTADILLETAFDHCFPNAKIALFALGKLGSSELNLSSDVDVLLVAQDEESIFLPGLRRFQKLLTEHTFQGFVFRVDFDLRPGGKQGPLIPTIEQLKDYYGNYGETWERLAMVRLRYIAGSLAVRDEVLPFAKKFSFRRHLDFTLLEDLKTLRSKIQGQYWSRSQAGVIDLKLGVGGIRDVELFTHALQVIHGGRDTELQICGTTQALSLMAQKKLLPQADVDFLKTHYWGLRGLENYVQALNDEQTHLLKPQDSHPEFVQEALQTLPQKLARCETIVRDLLGDAPQAQSVDVDLKKVGISDRELQDLWSEILGQEVLSRTKARDEVSRKAFLTQFLETLRQQNGDVRRGLLLLKDFIHGTRAKASFFAMLVREKELLEELAWLFGHSPYLSRILCNRPELLDSFVYRAQDKHSQDIDILLEELAEKRLLTEIINGSSYLEDKDVLSLQRNLSSTADSIVENLLHALTRQYPSDLQVLALGKWGGQELGFRSDLDFVFVTPEEPQENDFKVAKRFITRLTETHRGGNIYSIDMRLRPSGKAGPLVSSLEDLKKYLATEASAWERQAYLKARWIGPSQTPLWETFIYKGLHSEDLRELERIRLQLLSGGESLDLKYSEGGLVDVELAAQTSILFYKRPPANSSTIEFVRALKSEKETLLVNYIRLRQIEQMLQLVASESLTELQSNHESFQSLALALQLTSAQLENEVRELFADNIRILKELDPRRSHH